MHFSVAFKMKTINTKPAQSKTNWIQLVVTLRTKLVKVHVQIFVPRPKSDDGIWDINKNILCTRMFYDHLTTDYYITLHSTVIDTLLICQTTIIAKQLQQNVTRS